MLLYLSMEVFRNIPGESEELPFFAHSMYGRGARRKYSIWGEAFFLSHTAITHSIWDSIILSWVLQKYILPGYFD